MVKIRAGMVSFDPAVQTLNYTLLSTRGLVDELKIIYGRFKGFDMEYVEFPDQYKADWIHLILSDGELVQNLQRDLYLKGLKTGDILLVLDDDDVPVVQDHIGLMAELREGTWDSALVPALNSHHGWEQSTIKLYRFQEGWTHSEGQLLQDLEGKTITSPYHEVWKVPKDMFHITHYRDYKSLAYTEAQKKMWKKTTTQEARKE